MTNKELLYEINNCLHVDGISLKAIEELDRKDNNTLVKTLTRIITILELEKDVEPILETDLETNN